MSDLLATFKIVNVARIAPSETGDQNPKLDSDFGRNKALETPF